MLLVNLSCGNVALVSCNMLFMVGLAFMDDKFHFMTKATMTLAIYIMLAGLAVYSGSVS